MSAEDHISIEGTLLMLDDATPHVAVVVQAVQDGQVVATVLSDERGRYQLVDLEPGEYQLRCHVLGRYVYYGEGGKSVADESSAMLLQIGHRITRDNINLRFPPFKKGTWRNYTWLDGLAGDRIWVIYRDLDGNMWFGDRGGGVTRYGENGFVTFTTKDGLLDDHVNAIYQTPDGMIWFGAGPDDRNDGGISRYDGKTFVNFTTEDGLASNRVRAICRDTDGNLWFATWGGGVSRYDGEAFTNYTMEDGLCSNNVNTIYQEPDGAIWFGTGRWWSDSGGGGVSRYDGETFTNFTTLDGLADNTVNAITSTPDGALWFGTRNGVSRYDGKTFTNFTTANGLINNVVLTIHCDSDGILWFGYINWGGVSRYDGKTFVNFGRTDGLVEGSVYSIHQDPDGVLWFGTQRGVFRYDRSTFINFADADGLRTRPVWTIYQDSDKDMWIGGGWAPVGVYRYDGEEFVNLTAADGLADDCVYAIHQTPDGIMWFGTGNGVSRYDGTKFANLTLTTADGWADTWVIAINHDSDGALWFGTRNGAYRYDGETFTNFAAKDGLTGFVQTIYRDDDGVMWFGTNRGGIYRYDGGKFINLTAEDGPAADYLWSIHEDPDGIMWFGLSSWAGSGGGLSRYDGREFINFSTEDGLAHNVVRDIHRDSNGILWAATSGGVSGYDGGAWTSLDTRDGLPGNQVWTVYQDSEGYLWFGTLGGLTRYRRTSNCPKVYIKSVTTDKIYRDPSTVPAFVPGMRVIIEYNSIDLKTLPEKRQYRCRIREIDSDWRKPTKSDTFDFIFDNPGTYTFEVQAIDRDLNYSEPASVKLKVIPDPRNHQIAQLRGELAERERAEMERMQQELEDARRIQQSLLPDEPPEVEGFEIAGISHPAKEVSGDFYTYLSLGKNTGIVLADVTGKSVKAAMVAAMTSGMLNEAIGAQSKLWNSPSMILSRLNSGLQPHLIRGMYTAMSLGILTPDRRLIFSNAGMPYPIVKRGNEVWELELSGLPLGLTDSAEYDELGIDLQTGDIVVFYSDGVIEATNESDEMYQTERLLEVVQQADPCISAQGLLDLIVGDVTEFVGDIEPSDDMTVVVIRCYVTHCR